MSIAAGSTHPSNCPKTHSRPLLDPHGPTHTFPTSFKTYSSNNLSSGMYTKSSKSEWIEKKLKIPRRLTAIPRIKQDIYIVFVIENCRFHGGIKVARFDLNVPDANRTVWR